MAMQQGESLSTEVEALRSELAEVERKDAETAAELAALEDARHEIEDRLQLLRRVAADFEARIVEKESALARARQAEEQWRASLAERNEAAVTLAQSLETALAAYAVLEGKRLEADEAKETFEALLVDDTPTWSEFVDEPDFRPESWERLVEGLHRGPERPLAQLEAEREERRRNDERLLEGAVERGGPALASLPEHLRDEALRRREEREAEWGRLERAK
ncbi:MAG: hypothetical protein H0T39_13005 [Actinobacteria bacterium]|nr:hypothetical protein [Actinomycetota bacterium]